MVVLAFASCNDLPERRRNHPERIVTGEAIDDKKIYAACDDNKLETFEDALSSVKNFNTQN